MLRIEIFLSGKRRKSSVSKWLKWFIREAMPDPMMTMRSPSLTLSWAGAGLALKATLSGLRGVSTPGGSFGLFLSLAGRAAVERTSAESDRASVVGFIKIVRSSEWMAYGGEGSRLSPFFQNITGRLLATGGVGLVQVGNRLEILLDSHLVGIPLEVAFELFDCLRVAL